jgi:hypothetical protein
MEEVKDIIITMPDEYIGHADIQGIPEGYRVVVKDYFVDDYEGVIKEDENGEYIERIYPFV